MPSCGELERSTREQNRSDSRPKVFGQEPKFAPLDPQKPRYTVTMITLIPEDFTCVSSLPGVVRVRVPGVGGHLAGAAELGCGPQKTAQETSAAPRQLRRGCICHSNRTHLVSLGEKK